MVELLFEKETYAIRGAAFEVYNEMGSGFSEGIYHECLEMLFDEQKLEYKSQPPISVYFRKKKLRKRYIPDFICFGAVIVEIKAIDQLTSHDTSQMIGYLKATGYKLGLLINFGSKKGIEIQRVVL